MTWHVGDFAPEDVEAAIRLDAVSTMTAQQPLFDASDVATSLQGRHPAVVAVARNVVVGVAVSRVDADRAWVLRLSLDPAWRGKGLGKQPSQRIGASAAGPRRSPDHSDASRRGNRHSSIHQLRVRSAERDRTLRQARDDVAAVGCSARAPRRGGSSGRTVATDRRHGPRQDPHRAAHRASTIASWSSRRTRCDADEVEEVASQRGSGSLAATAVVNELLKCLVQFRDRSGRLLVCATNSVRDLDSQHSCDMAASITSFRSGRRMTRRATRFGDAT